MFPTNVFHYDILFTVNFDKGNKILECEKNWQTKNA